MLHTQTRGVTSPVAPVVALAARVSRLAQRPTTRVSLAACPAAAADAMGSRGYIACVGHMGRNVCVLKRCMYIYIYVLVSRTRCDRHHGRGRRSIWAEGPRLREVRGVESSPVAASPIADPIAEVVAEVVVGRHRSSVDGGVRRWRWRWRERWWCAWCARPAHARGVVRDGGRATTRGRGDVHRLGPKRRW